MQREKVLQYIFFFHYDAGMSKDEEKIMEITIQCRRKGGWSSKFDECQCCKTKKKKHYSKGLCQACYARTYRDFVKKKQVMDANKP
jgi:hypothetical protein